MVSKTDNMLNIKDFHFYYFFVGRIVHYLINSLYICNPK